MEELRKTKEGAWMDAAATSLTKNGGRRKIAESNGIDAIVHYILERNN